MIAEKKQISLHASTPVFDQITALEHENLVFCHDKETGLKAIIGIHNTTLGPSLGGTRFWKYNSDAEAIYDVLRLSRGMTYKSSLAGINLGGGKAVIIGDPHKDKSEALWRRFGQFVNSLGGRYITAEDVGTNMSDMETIALETKYVTGKPEYLGGSGDPSPFTAYGTYLGMKASVKHVFGNDSLEGKKIVVQGIGHVGQFLLEHLQKEKAKIIVSDIREEHLKIATSKYGATVVDMDKIYDTDCDIYAPCALGATVNSETIDRLKCSIICGAANNQLEDEVIHGNMLKDKGILYAPDFLVNAGGVINVYMEWVGYNREKVMSHCDKIYDRTLEIIHIAENEGITTHDAAVRSAEKRIRETARLNAKRPNW